MLTRSEQVSRIKTLFRDSIALKQRVIQTQAETIAKMAEAICQSLEQGGKVLLCGNGGSAADAQHMAAELVGRFERERAPLAAIALTTDTSVLTSLANDYGQEAVFARQIEAIGGTGDVAIAISTSGNSQNVLEGVHAARRLGMQTIGMTGRTGGKLADLVDLCLCVPSDNTARIQEAHGLIIHILCSLVESSITLAI